MTDYDDKLESRQIGNYLDALASSAPAPGGGSVAGLVGALAAGLGEMVVNLTRNPDPTLVETAERLTDIRASTIASGAADELAYGAYVRASKMPRDTEDQKALRKATMQEALEEAAAVPMALARTAVQLLEHLEPIVRLGSKHVISDAAIAITLALACVEASMINVRINLPMIRNTEVAESLDQKARQTEQHARDLAQQLRSQLASRT